MSKLGCVCGHVIRDQTDNLPYKGLIIRDKHYDRDFDVVLDEIAAFMQAVQQGKRHEWLATRFSENYANLKLDDTSVISSLWSAFVVKYTLDIYQCENCGRVHIEGKNNYFHSFKPDKADSQGVLDVEPKT